MAEAHIPAALEDFGLEMFGVKVVAGNYPTVFVGIVNEPTYTDDMWINHKLKIMELFEIDDQYCLDVRVYSRGKNSTVINDETLKDNFKAAVTEINKHSLKQLRIVHLGVGSSKALDEGLEHLISSWNVESNERKLQFVAMGETENFHYLNFCRLRICMKGLVATLQYYNTMDYNPFGRLTETSPSERILGRRWHSTANILTAGVVVLSLYILSKVSISSTDRSVLQELLLPIFSKCTP